jgi:hypothetical protein
MTLAGAPRAFVRIARFGSYLDFRGSAASRTTFIPHPVRRLSVVLDDSAPDVEYPPGIQSSCIR